MDIPTGDPREQATPYLRALGTLWGFGELTTVAAWNMDYVTPGEAQARIDACVEEALALVRAW
jgi:FMN-dependent NADH-azoreductase